MDGVAEGEGRAQHRPPTDAAGHGDKDPEVGKCSLPLGLRAPGADVQESTSAGGALPVELLVPTRSAAQAVHARARKKKSAKVVAAAGGRPSREQHEDDLFVLMGELAEDEVFTEFDFLHVRGVEFDDFEVLTSSRRM
jgi:hypothetical protein